MTGTAETNMSHNVLCSTVHGLSINDVCKKRPTLDPSRCPHLALPPSFTVVCTPTELRSKFASHLSLFASHLSVSVLQQLLGNLPNLGADDCIG